MAHVIVEQTFQGALPPPEELRPLDRLLGHWQGSGSLTAEPEEGELLVPTFQIGATFDCARAVAGHGMSIRMTITGLPDQPVWEANGLFGIDPGTHGVHLFGITSTGETHDHLGNWADPDTLELRYQGVGDDGDTLEILSVRFQPDGTWELDVQVNQFGHEVERMRLGFAR